MTPILNWKELETIAKSLDARVRGQTMDRVTVLNRPEFPQGFLKSEWALRLEGGRSALVISVRPQRPYFYWITGQSLKTSEIGTRSGFDLLLAKNLKGRKISGVRAFEKERLLAIDFEIPREGTHSLLLWLVPAAPEAFWVKGTEILARSRDLESKLKHFEFPRGNAAPSVPELRPFAQNIEAYSKVVERSLLNEAIEIRKKRIETDLRARDKYLKGKRRQNETSVQTATEEPDWARYAALLQANLHHNPKPAGRSISVHDYETDELVELPHDPRLSIREQLQAYYRSERRKKKRAEEAHARLQNQIEDEALVQKLQSQLQLLNEPTIEALSQIESELGIATVKPGERPLMRKTSWKGRRFTSKEGHTILVGRTVIENLELTFRIAKGNDFWLHVRGKPGAHVVILMPAGKSPPLDTLLDAAALAVYYSGGENWSKTDVEYTQKKYVKRIKNSTEVSYSQSKTLNVDPKDSRLARLLGKTP